VGARTAPTGRWPPAHLVCGAPGQLSGLCLARAVSAR
jgi:hypothetical protein